jgi:hypothetical protein
VRRFFLECCFRIDSRSSQPRIDLAQSQLTSGASLGRGAGLLLPALFVHAEHEEPQDQRGCPEEAEKCNAEEQTRLKVPI